MEKVTGIKSVDFKVKALGHGVVNWNGSPTLTIVDEKKFTNVNNHSMPKLRGYSNVKAFNEDGSAKFYHHPEEVDLTKIKLYISQNCIRHHLFRENSYNLNSDSLKLNPIKLLCSIVGLVRGYVIPSNENKRTSPLLITDFVDELGNGNFEQMGRSGSKAKETNKAGKESSNAIFSKMTFGDTKYTAYGSISVELLQFIPLCADFGRQAILVNNEKEAVDIARQLAEFLRSISGKKEVDVSYHKNYVRRGTIFDEGEAGLLLNDAAIDALVDATLELVKDLSIRQGKGYMYVDDIEVDYNDGVGKNMMRIKHSPEQVQPQKNQSYSIYYEGK